jgi:hypothetical protein
VFDNRSGFPKGFADLLSSLVTGSGDSKRELYTTDGEYAFKVKRPVIVNGINIPSDRADLLSRFVALEVPPISAEERLPESRFWEEFEEERGQALGRVLRPSVGRPETCDVQLLRPKDRPDDATVARGERLDTVHKCRRPSSPPAG